MRLINYFVYFRSGVPNLGYIFLSEGVHLTLAIEEQNIFTYNFFPNICTYISEYSFQQSLYAYCLIYLWIRKCFVTANFRGTCSSAECWRGTCLSVEMLKGYTVRERLGTPALDHNFWTWNPSKLSQVSKYSDFSKIC